MDAGLLLPPARRAPEFAPGLWLNTQQPVTLNLLRGGVLLIDFWDYSCVNCLRTLPYVQEWHNRYDAAGLTIIGVHAPEFAFGKERVQVELALEELAVHYPVLLDADFKTWNAYDNRFWPAKYLIDAQGFIRYQQVGEGNYDQLEQAIQALLREVDPALDLPPIMNPLRPEDYPEVLCYRPTPDLRGGLRRGALGNPEGYAGGIPLVYRLPSQRQAGAFYVSGAWQAAEQFFFYQGRSEGIIQVPYEAVEVNAVLSPHPDAVERIVNPQTVSVEVWQDDSPLNDSRRGADLTEDGRLLVNRPRMYNLIRNPGFESHELTLRVHAPGFALYGFSFVSGVRD